MQVTTRAQAIAPVKKFTKDDIRAMLETNDKAVARGLVRIYQLQTSDEQQAQYTKHSNGVGFTGADSTILTSLAQWYLTKGYLSAKQMSIAKRRMLKYAGQLAKVANGKLITA